MAAKSTGSWIVGVAIALLLAGGAGWAMDESARTADDLARVAADLEALFAETGTSG